MVEGNGRNAELQDINRLEKEFKKEHDTLWRRFDEINKEGTNFSQKLEIRCGMTEKQVLELRDSNLKTNDKLQKVSTDVTKIVAIGTTVITIIVLISRFF